MRMNLPVSQRAFEFAPEATLMSMTDTSSRITYANSAFLEVSGFEREELMGQPHNLVRHPDMPVQAFEDMWATLKSGKSWTGLVKNRRKNGDHYWVRANATPVSRGGRVSGYMSVRTRPSAQEVQAAERLYRDFREGRAAGRAFHQGLIVRTGWRGWTAWLQTLSVRGRLRCAMAVPAVASLAGAALCGVAPEALVAWALAALGLSTAVGAWLESQIARPLGLIERQALSVAAGQPAENVHLNRVDEIGMILRAVNQAGLNLRSLVDDVGAQVGGVQAASAGMAAGNQDLRGRTEQAAASLEETATSMEQINATVKNNATSASHATTLAASASEAAAQGGAVVGQVIATMQDLSAASSRIAEIIGVIDGIAFQTNILALNAAVEAARAGEQGRGFAVVAGEVRHLAQRCASAAREIKGLIGDSVAKVDSGVVQADEAGRAMREIVTQVQRVNGLIAEISHATQEQASGIGQVNLAVSHLDDMTQQNAALVERSAAEAESLQRRAERLAESVSVF
ncbi:methyl-accepting chemotaxis protein [Curvibacter sp. HBC61]|uniref:Methyl-accepting chemotaxis protein n=1 Tax=Curvibacter cyanobacteriorum TaxID=3026422 RepID=A0ABT5MVH9_9BURK|nr:PAS domain-containing methyl-accepting chemotaxis protein [Curvibacter sp. HBC61]MDD0838062.1 methyl-accepting chemotaxis protein [Curvibacter sp. HBC61]